MIETPTIPQPVRRDSYWGADNVYYPSEGEREVPISDAALDMIVYLWKGLRYLVYPRHEQVYIAADLFIYYVPGNPRKNIAPDVFVCYGVPKEPPRKVFRTWEEGATPSFVVEVSSSGSRESDQGEKLALYRDVLQCRKYLIYDEDRDELILFRREGDEFREVPPGPDGRLYSREVDAWFGREPGILVRLYDAQGGPVPDTDELFERTAALEGVRRRMEQEAAELGARAAEADRPAEEADREIARLRSELDQFRQRRDG